MKRAPRIKQQRFYYHPAFSVATLLVGVIGTIAATNVFAHGGDSLKIHACVRDVNGAIRIVGEGDGCKTGESPLDWNIKGDQGQAGAPGAPATNSGLPYSCFNCYLGIHADKFAGKDHTGIQLHNVVFGSVDLSGVIFKKGFFRSVNFRGANLTGADFSELIQDIPNSFDASSGNIFINANLTGANFSNSRIRNSDFSNANFTNATLLKAELLNDNFSGAVWSNTICPDNTNSDSNGKTCVGHF